LVLDARVRGELLRLRAGVEPRAFWQCAPPSATDIRSHQRQRTRGADTDRPAPGEGHAGANRSGDRRACPSDVCSTISQQRGCGHKGFALRRARPRYLRRRGFGVCRRFARQAYRFAPLAPGARPQVSPRFALSLVCPALPRAFHCPNRLRRCVQHQRFAVPSDDAHRFDRHLPGRRTLLDALRKQGAVADDSQARHRCGFFFVLGEFRTRFCRAAAHNAAACRRGKRDCSARTGFREESTAAARAAGIQRKAERKTLNRSRRLRRRARAASLPRQLPTR
jgi:hypothetical protein